jgi:hypothetical protein
MRSSNELCSVFIPLAQRGARLELPGRIWCAIEIVLVRPCPKWTSVSVGSLVTYWGVRADLGEATVEGASSVS